MAEPILETLEAIKLHHFQEPWTLEELEQMPHLHSVAQTIRDQLQAHKTLRDLDLENRMEYEAFLDLCTHNLLFYLKITHQYYLISKLFNEPRLHARWIRHLNHSRHHHHERLHQQQAALHNTGLSKSTTPELLHHSLHPALFGWEHPSSNTSNIGKWQHYEQELHRITDNYRNQRTRVYSQSYEATINQINAMVGVMRNSGRDGNRPAIRELEVIRDQFRMLRSELLHSPMNSVEATKSINAAMVGRLEQFFSNYTGSDPEINHLRMEYKTEQTRLARELNELDRSFEEQNRLLTQQIATARLVVKNDLNKWLAAVAKTFNDIKTSESQHVPAEFMQDAIERFEHFQARLRTTDNFDEVQTLLNESREELINIAEVLPEPIKAQLIHQAELLNQPAAQPQAASYSQAELSNNFGVFAAPQRNPDRRQIHLPALAKEQPQSIIEQQKNMKAALHERQHGNEEKRELDAELESISKKIKSLDMEIDYTQGDKELIHQLNAAIGKIKRYEDCQSIPIEIYDSIVSTVETLSYLNENLIDIKEQLETVLKPVSPSSYHQSASNLSHN